MAETIIFVGLVTIIGQSVSLEMAHGYGSDLTRVYPFSATIGNHDVLFSCKTATKCVATTTELPVADLIDTLRNAKTYDSIDLSYKPHASLEATINGEKKQLEMPLIKKYISEEQSASNEVIIEIPAGDNMNIRVQYNGYSNIGQLDAYLGSFRLYNKGLYHEFVLEVYNTVRDDVLKWDYYLNVKQEVSKGERCALYFIAKDAHCSTSYEFNGKKSSIPCTDIYVNSNQLTLRSDATKPEKYSVSVNYIIGIIALVLILFFIICLPISCARDNRRDAKTNRPIILGFGVNNAIKVRDQNLKYMVNASLVGFFGKDIALEVLPIIKRYKSIAVVYEADWWEHGSLQKRLYIEKDETSLNQFKKPYRINIEDYVLPEHYSAQMTDRQLTAEPNDDNVMPDEEFAQLAALYNEMNDELPPEYGEEYGEVVPEQNVTGEESLENKDEETDFASAEKIPFDAALKFEDNRDDEALESDVGGVSGEQPAAADVEAAAEVLELPGETVVAEAVETTMVAPPMGAEPIEPTKSTESSASDELPSPAHENSAESPNGDEHEMESVPSPAQIARYSESAPKAEDDGNSVNSDGHDDLDNGAEQSQNGNSAASNTEENE